MPQFDHFISAQNLDLNQLEAIFDIARKYKKEPQQAQKILQNKIIATLFFEPSTRTRLSFESAIFRLGANCLSTENALMSSSHSKGESLEDSIKVISAYCDALIMRHPQKGAAETASTFSSVPIINAGDGAGEHPTQACLDLFTIHEKFLHFENLHYVFAGDLKNGRTIHSLLKLLSLIPKISVTLISPLGLGLGAEYLDQLSGPGRSVTQISSFGELKQKADVLYLTRIQKEREKEISSTWNYYLDWKTMDQIVQKEGIVLHPLPRVDELDTTIDHDPRAYYFHQAANGVWVRMALLSMLKFARTSGA